LGTLAVALGFAALADGLGWLTPWFPAEYLIVTPALADLGEAPAAVPVHAEFRLRNRLDRPIHVLGFSGD
jgi:hypothetical protein